MAAEVSLAEKEGRQTLRLLPALVTPSTEREEKQKRGLSTGSKGTDGRGQM